MGTRNSKVLFLKSWYLTMGSRPGWEASDWGRLNGPEVKVKVKIRFRVSKWEC